MSEQTVSVEPVEKTKKVKQVKEPKPPAEPRLGKKWTAEAWTAKIAEMTVQQVPVGWLNMAQIVKKAVENDIGRSRICAAMGGDRCASEPWDEVFKVVYVGGRKYGSPEILTRGFELLKDPEYHKPARRGRTKKEKSEGDGSATAPATPAAPKKLKVSAPTEASAQVWTEKK